MHPFGNALGDPPRVFVEGLAMVLGGGVWSDGALPKDDAIVDLLDDDYFLHAGGSITAKHGAAMSLVAYLVDRYGWPWLIDLYRRMPHDADAAARWLEEATGSSLDELTDAWRASPAGSTGAGSVENPYRCGPALEHLELNVPERIELALGVSPEPGTTHFAGGAIRSFAVPDDSLLRWRRVDSGAPGRAQLSACEGAAHRSWGFDPGVEIWNDVRAGRYWLSLYFDDDSTGDLTAQVDPMEPYVGGDCAALTPARPSDSGETFIAHSPEHTVEAFDCVDGACTGWLRLATAEPLEVRVTRILSEGAWLRWTALSSCEGCAGTCTELRVYEREPTDALVVSPTDGELTLRIEMAESLAATAGLSLRLVPSAR